MDRQLKRTTSQSRSGLCCFMSGDISALVIPESDAGKYFQVPWRCFNARLRRSEQKKLRSERKRLSLCDRMSTYTFGHSFYIVNARPIKRVARSCGIGLYPDRAAVLTFDHLKNAKIGICDKKLGSDVRRSILIRSLKPDGPFPVKEPCKPHIRYGHDHNRLAEQDGYSIQTASSAVLKADGFSRIVL